MAPIYALTIKVDTLCKEVAETRQLADSIGIVNGYSLGGYLRQIEEELQLLKRSVSRVKFDLKKEMV